jgi:hypothetical protein
MTEEKIGERLVRIETQLKILSGQWEQHTEQDREHYAEISEKVTALLIDKAIRTGEDKGMRRVAGWISFCVATVISVAAVIVTHLMGGG